MGRAETQRRSQLYVRILGFCITYLMLLFAALLVDHYLPPLAALLD